MTATSPYRFLLWRNLQLELGHDHRGTLLWIMLNPSTADDQTDDATIRRIKTFTAREQYGRLEVVNLLPQRATDPDGLHPPSIDELGRNRVVVDEAIRYATRVVAAWGATRPRAVRSHIDASIDATRRLADRHNQPLWCLGTTAAGHPRHPLYVKTDAPLVEYGP